MNNNQLLAKLKETFNYGPSAYNGWELRGGEVRMIDYMNCDFGGRGIYLYMQALADGSIVVSGDHTGTFNYDDLISRIESWTWHRSVETRRRQEAETERKYAEAEAKLTDEDRAELAIAVQKIAECEAKIKSLNPKRNEIKARLAEIQKELDEVEAAQSELHEIACEYAGCGIDLCHDLEIKVLPEFRNYY